MSKRSRFILNGVFNRTVKSDYLTEEEKIVIFHKIADFLNTAQELHIINGSEELRDIWSEVFTIKEEEASA